MGHIRLDDNPLLPTLLGFATEVDRLIKSIIAIKTNFLETFQVFDRFFGSYPDGEHGGIRRDDQLTLHQPF